MAGERCSRGSSRMGLIPGLESVPRHHEAQVLDAGAFTRGSRLKAGHGT